MLDINVNLILLRPFRQVMFFFCFRMMNSNYDTELIYHLNTGTRITTSAGRAKFTYLKLLPQLRSMDKPWIVVTDGLDDYQALKAFVSVTFKLKRLYM